MSDAYGRTERGFFEGLTQKIEALERRLVSGGVPSSGAGSTAARDGIYGVPATAAERATLANRRVKWWNHDTGWEESYYAPLGTSGLTARALMADVSAGWYPTGLGPYLVLEPLGIFPASPTNFIGNWHNGNAHRRGGADWFTATANGMMQIKKSGVYDISFWTSVQPGSGAVNLNFQLWSADLVTLMRQADGLAVELMPSLSTRQTGEFKSMRVNAGWQAGVLVHSGSANVHYVGVNPRAQMVARYLGPALVFD